MKVTYRIPTEMYSYVEIEEEYHEMPSASEIKQTYDDLSGAFKAQAGLEKKEFDGFMDRYLTGDLVHVEEYNKMSQEQQMIIQAIKRSKKRIQAKEQ